MLDNYNESLSSLDQLLNEFEAAENDQREKNRRILAEAEVRYGPDSSEYEQVGSKRTRRRKRPDSKGPSPTTPPA